MNPRNSFLCSIRFLHLEKLKLAFGFLILTVPTYLSAQLPQPNIYQAVKANEGIEIDGLANEPNWQTAPWSNDFVDIEGDAKPLQEFRISSQGNE